MSNNAISDTCLFLFGMCIGIIFDYTFKNCVDWYGATTRRQYFSIGILQILANAAIIRYVRQRIKNTGLFTLGLLSSQSLVIKKCHSEI